MTTMYSTLNELSSTEAGTISIKGIKKKIILSIIKQFIFFFNIYFGKQSIGIMHFYLSVSISIETIFLLLLLRHYIHFAVIYHTKD